MNNEELVKKINEIDQIGNSNFTKTLNRRKVREWEFHDIHRDASLIQGLNVNDKDYKELYGNKKFYKTTERSREFVRNWINKESKNKVFLDYACGEGENAILAAKAGANLSLGFDISSIAVIKAKNNSENLNNLMFFQADAENTNLPDKSIDLIVCSGMLHHLDLSYAFPEMQRILKPGGKILAIEALDFNYFIKLYRRYTQKMRTEWEAKHILSLKEVKLAEKYFQVKEVKFWHVIGYLSAIFPSTMKIFNNIDRLLEKVPGLQKMAWIFTFELVKKD